jgi:hypothetical protein
MRTMNWRAILFRGVMGMKKNKVGVMDILLTSMPRCGSLSFAAAILRWRFGL